MSGGARGKLARTMNRSRAAALLILLLGACAAPRAAAPAPAPAPLRIVAYNIKHGRGMDGAVDLDRIAAVLAPLDADLVLLQEVDEVCGRSGGVDEAAFLGERLGMEPRFCSFMDHDGGRYGLATLSRLPIVAEERIDLPDGTEEPRAAEAVTVQLGGRRVRVVNAHLDWKADGARRLAQARVLREVLVRQPEDVTLTILGGDLNAKPGSPTLTVFQAGDDGLRRLGPDGPTFPSDAPDRTIDHFLVAPADAGVGAPRCWVVDEPMASDHCPVVLELEVGR